MQTAEAMASPFHLGGWLASDGIPPSRHGSGLIIEGSLTDPGQ
jgi:hypothetical protein